MGRLGVKVKVLAMDGLRRRAEQPPVRRLGREAEKSRKGQRASGRAGVGVTSIDPEPRTQNPDPDPAQAAQQRWSTAPARTGHLAPGSGDGWAWARVRISGLPGVEHAPNVLSRGALEGLRRMAG
ncbi:hypothetical protein CCMA1212_002096 [Trichoderma ghanense]|uniref:Uncharacterized protein n=1 Tax=Trichoderma ghanense TaxID=65468 RepID=A0ABY2HG61_9HYPO